jgi:hypothetical protein
LIDPAQFRELIVRPVLQALKKWSVAAENLLLGTALQESGLRYLKQLGGGPALGVYQMEPATHQDIWINYLNAREDLKYKVLEWHEESMIDPSAMTWNLAYATAMARVHYLRVKEPLPEAHNIMDMAEYWKAHYNTPRGAGTPEEYVANYVTGRGE